MNPDRCLEEIRLLISQCGNVFRHRLPNNNDNLKTRIGESVQIILDYGHIDGDHHKAWVIDQVMHELLKDQYEEFVEWYEQDGEYEWEKGIAP